MGHKTTMGALLLAILGAGCAPPEDAFVGFYTGTYSCSGAWDNGDPYNEGPAPQNVDIQQDRDGSIFQAGRACSLPLVARNSERAEYLVSTCSVVLPNGAPGTYVVDGGIFELDEPTARYDQAIRVLIDDTSYFIAARCTWNGVRSE
jgi:hypothetical protein